MSRFLSVLPEAGGNVPPTLELLRELAGRGHEVSVLGHRQVGPAVGSAGLPFRPFARARPWSAVVENPGFRSMLGYLPLASDRGIAADIREVTAAESPDVILVDCMVPVGLPAARAGGARVVLVMHTLYGYWDAQWSPRAPMGCWLRATRTSPMRPAARPDLALLTTMPELDRLPGRTRIAPELIRQTGPLSGPAPPRSTDASGPVLVSLSTISYPGQREVLRRIVAAVGTLGVPVVVTTGPSVDPRDLDAPAGVEVRRFVPHDEILPRARLVIGHGGHGTTMRALAHGVPVLVLPMSRHADHALVGRALSDAGAGSTVPKSAPVDQLRDAVRAALGDPAMRAAAGRIADLLRGRDAAAAAADAVTGLVTGR
jgi:UDP:flavonoid glycosyltransferase YjiC (YdhE family)